MLLGYWGWRRFVDEVIFSKTKLDKRNMLLNVVKRIGLEK